MADGARRRREATDEQRSVTELLKSWSEQRQALIEQPICGRADLYLELVHQNPSTERRTATSDSLQSSCGLFS